MTGIPYLILLRSPWENLKREPQHWTVFVLLLKLEGDTVHTTLDLMYQFLLNEACVS